MELKKTLLVMCAAMLPFAGSAEIVRLDSEPQMKKDIQAEGIYSWPASIVVSEDMVDRNAEPIAVDPRANLASIPAEELGDMNGARDLDDLTQIFIDGFFPGWDANWAGPYGGGYDDDGVFHNWRWTERTERSSVGSYAAYCAGDATEVPDPELDTYPDDMVTWMYYGPVDMSGYDGAALEFDFFLDCETRYDNFFAGISTDGVNFEGNFYSGYDAAWATDEMISMDFPGGESSVYFLFKFNSDYTVSSGEGVWVDQVRVHGEVDGDPDLQITDVTWTPMNPAAGAMVDVTIDYENAGPDNAGPFYIDLFTDIDGVIPEIGQTSPTAYYNSGGLAAGASTSYTFSYSYPSNGTRWIYALIDTDEIVDESNENNNTWGYDKIPVGIATIIDAGPVAPGIVPPGGGAISYPVTATQYTALQTRIAWVTISYEGYGNAVEVFATAGPINLVPGAPISTSLSHFIPGNAPAGNYWVNVNFGNYPWTPWDSGRTTFFKDGPAPNGAPSLGNIDFETFGGEALNQLASTEATEVSMLPEEFEMGAAYPNPFNPSTTISVALPEAAELNVTVFNLQGQQVATIAQGQHQAGNHQMVFDARGLASGVYLVKASASTGESAVQKIMLMK